MPVYFCLETMYYVFYLIKFIVNLLNMGGGVQMQLIWGGGLTKQIDAFNGGSSGY